MAKQITKVYLGYEEEAISDKNATLLSYATNKIGGLPDWPPLDKVQLQTQCPLCGLHRLLVVQCYAPLEHSVYHRTLYVFACINTNCWNQSESWTCVRSQWQDKTPDSSSVVAMPDTNLTWCSGADEWDENDNDAANGNVMNVDNAPNIQRNSDDEEESNSLEIENVEQALGNLQVYDAHNANMSPVQGAMGAIGAATAAAELEGGDEPGLVSVDTPTAPTDDIQALLLQTAELPLDLRSRLMNGPLQFKPKYIYVEEETNMPSKNDDKVSELLHKYTKENDLDVGGDRIAVAGCGGGDEEMYEEATPLHGDKLFHTFLTRLRNHPGQILRYSRDSPPLLGAPLPKHPSTPGLSSPTSPTVCLRCGSKLICELQLVPQFAETLQISYNNTTLSHLHFLSILVFTCSQSCWQPDDSIVKELVVVQPEVV